MRSLRFRSLVVAAALLVIATAETPQELLPPPVAREFRAAWVSPIASSTGADWPSQPGLPADVQQAELRALLDRAKSIGLNAIILHVRLSADALYPTKLAPWSAFLSGTSGVAPTPFYDPLAFAVAEAHARGLQLHAWFNPFRALLPNIHGSAAASHVTKTHPSWIRTYGTQTWINPGEPAARAAVIATILDVVDRYDIDGVHLDDYFYPYREQRPVVKKVGKRRVTVQEDIEFPDYTAWMKYGVAKGYTDRAEWRRANVDEFVQQLHDAVKARKPWVAFGISPFGIWRSGTPEGVTGLDSYGEIYTDARKWLMKGWVDYLAPQLYWQVDGVENRFSALDDWWRTQNPLHRYIWPGLYTSQIFSTRTPWPEEAITTQIARIRTERVDSTEPPGHFHFRMGALVPAGGLGDRLRDSLYVNFAIPPAMPGLGGARPALPIPLVRGDSLLLSPGDTTPVAWWLVQTRGGDGAWTPALRIASDGQIPLSALGDIAGGRIAVTAIDRVGQASGVVVVEIR